MNKLTNIKRNDHGEKVAILEHTLDDLQVIRKAFIFAIDNMDFKEEQPRLYSLLTESDLYSKVVVAMNDLKKDFKT